MRGTSLRRHPHLYRSDGLVDLVKRFLPLNDLAQLSVRSRPERSTSTTLASTSTRTGDPRQVLVASASLPGVFRPVVIDGSRHVDGGIAVNLPIQRARDLGRDD